jgi:quinol monooxygenase YgiN
VNGLAAERMKGASALPCRGSWIAGGAGARAFDPARKARLKGEPGTLQFEVLLPEDDDTKVLSFEMYRNAAAFELHLNGPSLAQLREEIAGIAMKLHGVRCAVVD